jgi:hypothetical protein
MKFKLFLIITLLLSVPVTYSYAQKNHRHYHNRPGINNGITKTEAFRLRHMKADLRRDYVRAKLNDGRIGPLERRHLLQERRQLKCAEFRFRNNRLR